MSQFETELAAAWEEVTFWQDYVKWWSAENNNRTPEPRTLAALENAWRRYEAALELRQKFNPIKSESSQ